MCVLCGMVRGMCIRVDVCVCVLVCCVLMHVPFFCFD